MIRTGLLGHPVCHSKSPAMHRAAFEAVGIEGRYDALDVPPEQVEQCLYGLREQGYRGVNVTVPHKEAVAALCDDLDPAARTVGAVNTVLWGRDGKTMGFNTDVAGFLTSLRADAEVEPSGCTALVVGAGGAARAVIRALQEGGAEQVVVTNRTVARAQALAESIDVVASAFVREALTDIQPTVVINATTCGMDSEPSSQAWSDAVRLFEQLPFDDWSTPFGYDLVYVPQRTAFLSVAKSHGCSGIGGLGMLVRQGALAFQLWTGVPAARVLSAMESAAHDDGATRS